MNIATDLLKSPSTLIMTTWYGWFLMAGGKHRAGVCESHDPRTIRSQIQLMKKHGISDAIVGYYGHNPDQSFPTLQATKELMVIAEEEGFSFSLMMDAGIYKWQGSDPAAWKNTFQSALGYAVQNFAGSPAYRTLNGKPLFWEFGTRAPNSAIDLASVVAANPGIALLTQDNPVVGGAGTFAWPNGFRPGDDPLAYMARYLAKADTVSSPPAVKVPCLFRQFDDHDPANPANSIWGGKARFIDGRNGDLWSEMITMVRAFASVSPMWGLQLTTWNDYEEGTELETFFKEQVGMEYPYV